MVRLNGKRTADHYEHPAHAGVDGLHLLPAVAEQEFSQLPRGIECLKLNAVFWLNGCRQLRGVKLATGWTKAARTAPRPPSPPPKPRRETKSPASSWRGFFCGCILKIIQVYKSSTSLFRMMNILLTIIRSVRKKATSKK